MKKIIAILMIAIMVAVVAHIGYYWEKFSPVAAYHLLNDVAAGREDAIAHAESVYGTSSYQELKELLK